MSSSWCLHSLGGEGKVWHLSKGKELSVGRDPRSDIVLQSQSVENQHAIFKWDSRDVCYIVKDLGSVNGTYINNRPVRGGSARVNHNDGIRFGYDKDHVFRMEEHFQEPSAKSKSASGSSSNSSSPVRSGKVGPLKVTALPQSTPTGQSNGSPLAVSPPPVSVAVPTGIQYVVVPAALPSTAVAGQQPSSQPIPLQSQQLLSAAPPPSSGTHEEQHQHCIHHALPIPFEDHASELQESPHRSDGRRGAGVENTPALNKASKLYGQPNWWGEGQEEGATATADALQAWKREFEFVKPGSQILRQLEPSGEGGSRSRDLSSSTPPRLSSKDGLRLQAIANSRSHDTTSSWVVEFGGGGGGGGVATGTVPRVRRPRDRTMRPRSADPSPNRARAASSHERESSPVSTTTARKSATPTSTKRHASFSTRRTTATPIKQQQQQRASTPPVPISSAKTRTASPSRKPPPGSPKRKAAGSILQTPPQSPSRKTRSKTPQSNARSSKSGPPNSKTGALQSQPPQSPISCPPDSSSPNYHHPYPPPPAEATPTSIDLQSLNQGTLHQLMGSEGVAVGGAEEGERTYTMVPPSSSEESLPSLSDPTSHMEKRGVATTTRGSGMRDPTTTEESVATEGKSPPSNRKQWNKAADEQSADSLMMASIEARMRRLSRMAQQTARQTTALKNKIRDGQQVEVRGMDYLSLRDTSQVVTKSEEKLPEWKFFNKEANSIFRNIRVVEKWLQDIEGTLNSIRPVGQSASSEGEEGVDFASDGELYLDSMDNFESSSDPEDQSHARN